MNSEKVILEDISGDAQALAQIQKIYQYSFPKVERKPFEMILQKHEEGMADILGLKDGAVLCGMAATMRFEDKVLLDYLAVDRDMRGRGYGTIALKRLQEMFRDKQIILEIETVKEETPQIEMRRARKHFYLKNGLKEAGIYADVYSAKYEILSFSGEVDYEAYSAIYKGVYGDFFRGKMREMYLTKKDTLEYV